MNSMQRFLQKLNELIKSKLRNGYISATDYQAAIKAARGHSGGIARGEKLKAEREGKDGNDADNANPRDDGDDDTNQATEVSVMNKFKLMTEVALSEDGKTCQVQIFPPVGKYSHPRYGELNITPDFLQRIKANFDAKVYQQELPLAIDLEHETKLSGAAGWIDKVEIRGDKGMWATIPLNDRGSKLVGEDAYRYYSPEFYDKWQDPATSKDYTDVLIGGALTNRPFFKGMSPIGMIGSEGSFVFMEAAEGDDGDDTDTPEMSMIDAMGAVEDAMETMMDCCKDNPEQATALKPMISQMEAMLKKLEPMTSQAKEKKASEAPTKTEDGESYPAEAYLYAPDKTKPSEWKLRIWESPDAKVTRAQLGRAAAALGAGFRGQKVELPDGEKATAIAKLRGEYSKLGIKPDELPAQIKASLTESGLSEAEASAALVELGLAQSNGGNAMGMTDEEAKAFAETQASLKTLREELAEQKTAREKAEAEVKQASERVAAIERERNREHLTGFVRANRLAFSETEVSLSVDKLEKLQGKLGEDFDDYLAEKKSLSERIKASGIFSEVGSSMGAGVNGGGGAAAQIEALVSATMSANPQMSKADATAKVLGENPGLYNEQDKERNRMIKRGGE